MVCRASCDSLAALGVARRRVPVSLARCEELLFPTRLAGAFPHGGGSHANDDEGLGSGRSWQQGHQRRNLSETVMAFVDKMKPETCFFTAEAGMRTAFFVFDLTDPTSIPSLAEPFFMNLNASLTFSPVM